jgi:hypothetical protein
MVVREHLEGHPNLLQITDTVDAISASLHLAQRGQKQGSEDADDGHDTKQFDQAEPPSPMPCAVSLHITGSSASAMPSRFKGI